MSNHIIEPERHGLWIAATFVLALLAFAVAMIAMTRNHQLAVGTQIEVVALHKRLVALEKQPAAAPAAPAAVDAAPAAEAAAAK